ncbi:phosphotransferase [Agarivorans aestuarii]|uniref:Phosphotransferase n=1 Tax=Agarivorans aestuarii TaxID=1563703 RepID=A0ABU7G4N6_9ALTE|nr:phosphotransferase [Agarivorans aestuarii]MEE1674265.1 phosphotransferase [Agarivorans aestuarii]
MYNSPLPESIATYLQQQLGDILTVDRFAGGHQHSWLLATKHQRLVLRLNQQQPCYGLDYQREREVLQQLKGQAWAIDLHPLSFDGQFLLYHYQAGTVLSGLSSFDDAVWQQLLMLINSLPNLGQGLPEFDMLHYITRYVSDIEAAPASRFRQLALRWLEQQAWPSGKAFNHHDLHLDNLLLSPEQQLFVLDWEYAATSMPGWDAASVAVRCPVNAQQRQDLLAASGLSEKQFTLLEAAVELLDLAWYWQYQASFPELAQRSQAWLAAHC